jgi:hypothetical protein
MDGRGGLPHVGQDMAGTRWMGLHAAETGAKAVLSDATHPLSPSPAAAAPSPRRAPRRSAGCHTAPPHTWPVCWHCRAPPPTHPPRNAAQCAVRGHPPAREGHIKGGLIGSYWGAAMGIMCKGRCVVAHPTQQEHREEPADGHPCGDPHAVTALVTRATPLASAGETTQ